MRMKTMRRGLFGVATAAALGFGGAQAMASPAPVAAEEGPVCDTGLCNRACQALGLIGGFCTEPIGCSCYL